MKILRYIAFFILIWFIPRLIPVLFLWCYTSLNFYLPKWLSIAIIIVVVRGLLFNISRIVIESVFKLSPNYKIVFVSTFAVVILDYTYLFFFDSNNEIKNMTNNISFIILCVLSAIIVIGLSYDYTQEMKNIENEKYDEFMKEYERLKSKL